MFRSSGPETRFVNAIRFTSGGFGQKISARGPTTPVFSAHPITAKQDAAQHAMMTVFRRIM
jgi:hypothetical protein